MSDNTKRDDIKDKVNKLYILAYPGTENAVMYKTDKNEIYRWSEGSRSWRNNNPGNIRYGDYAKRKGAIGKAGGFACFSNKETGRKALRDLFKTSSYKNLTIEEAMNRFAPRAENNTESYIQHIISALKISPDTIIKDLTESQLDELVEIIEKHEKYIEGKIKFVERGEKYIWRTKKDENVRNEHRSREGKIFYWNNPPQGGHPGEAPGCRCRAEDITQSNRKRGY